MKASSNGVVQGVYAYDGPGRRVESVEGSGTFYAYLGTETLSELVSGGATTDYIYAAGLRIARTTGTTTSYYHTDALGSTRLVTDSKQNLLFSDNYQPFGQDNGSSGSETYKFTGKPVSQTTGLYYFYQRWYARLQEVGSVASTVASRLLKNSLGVIGAGVELYLAVVENVRYDCFLHRDISAYVPGYRQC